MSAEAPVDWYRTSLAGNHAALYGATGGAEKVALAVRILQPSGGERVLDLACGAGGRLLELCRRGFDAVGNDVRPDLLEAALGESELAGLEPRFIEADPRELEAVEDFDIALSLGAGAFGHYGSEEEDQRARSRRPRRSKAQRGQAGCRRQRSHDTKGAGGPDSPGPISPPSGRAEAAISGCLLSTGHSDHLSSAGSVASRRSLPAGFGEPTSP